MKAEIITIGDEILIGQVIDTNSAWMAEHFNDAGITVERISSIADKPEELCAMLDHRIGKVPLLVLTGGLGVTSDDATKETLTDYFGTALQFHEPTWDHIVGLFASIGKVPVELNREQAMVPEHCTLLFNRLGTAPGMMFEKDGTRIVSLPGVPYEMKRMVQQELLPLIAGDVAQHVKHQTYFVVGMPESELAQVVEPLLQDFPEAVQLAYLPKPGLVRLRLSIVGVDEVSMEADLKMASDQLKAALGQKLHGNQNANIEAYLGEQLLKGGYTMGTAESCTGGGIASLLVSVAGSSRYFNGGIVAYANEVKENVLGVPLNTLEKHGAVSEAVVRAMAEGAKSALNVDFSVAVSGVAGPGGGTPDKPVGTVWISVAGPARVVAQKYSFGRSRTANIEKTVYAALELMLKEVDNLL